MKFTTEDENDIKWMANPSDYEAGKTIQSIKDAGKWDEFLQLHADEDGEIDCDDLYDYLRFESGDALLDVGLHETESTHTVEEVLTAWENENAPLKVSRDENGKPTGLQIYGAQGYSKVYGSAIDFESVDEDGEVNDESLDNDEVFDLVGDNNSSEGEWTDGDPETAVFECWRGRR